MSSPTLTFEYDVDSMACKFTSKGTFPYPKACNALEHARLQYHSYQERGDDPENETPRGKNPEVEFTFDDQVPPGEEFTWTMYGSFPLDLLCNILGLAWLHFTMQQLGMSQVMQMGSPNQTKRVVLADGSVPPA